jgi:DNA invertase Pin-like site-specific DNA recombinase
MWSSWTDRARLAEFERDLLRERTQAGLVAARARGRLGGRRRVLDGKRLELARSLYADPKNAPRDIAKTLGVSLSTLYRYAAPSPLAAPSSATAVKLSRPKTAAKAAETRRPTRSR